MTDAALYGLAPDCVFCQKLFRAIRKGASSEGVTWHNRHPHAQDAQVASFEPLNPVVPGHRLFVPVRHVANAALATRDDLGGAFSSAAGWGAFQGEDFNLITSAGAAATQTVLHLHVHYVPRADGDSLLLPWTLQSAFEPGGVPGKKFYEVYDRNPVIHAIFQAGRQRGERVDDPDLLDKLRDATTQPRCGELDPSFRMFCGRPRGHEPPHAGRGEHGEVEWTP